MRCGNDATVTRALLVEGAHVTAATVVEMVQITWWALVLRFAIAGGVDASIAPRPPELVLHGNVDDNRVDEPLDEPDLPDEPDEEKIRAIVRDGLSTAGNSRPIPECQNYRSSVTAAYVFFTPNSVEQPCVPQLCG